MEGFVMDENMSNLTSASGGELTASSGSRVDTSGNIYQHQLSCGSANQAPLPPPQQQQQQKRKRSLPGNPDPDAEVIALSPKTLLAKNRFICEICNKGFQRDQNLQLHKRGHNLPWKLKQRANKEVVRKKVYVCPEPTCVHHDPSRALGDLTGIKKHFYRKHGEKKWKCDKCSKRYAVQSDWKAHFKICGTREYKCDCGTIFSRRDSFITHRAFCDALAEENARSAISGVLNPLLSSSSHHMIDLLALSSTIKREQETHLNFFDPSLPPSQENFSGINNNPSPWLVCPQVGEASSCPSQLEHQLYDYQNPRVPLSNPNTSHPRVSLPPFHPPPASSPHMSATALLQKAAQMGVTMSKPSSSSPSHVLINNGPQRQVHMPSEQNSIEFNNNNNNKATVLDHIAIGTSSLGGEGRGDSLNNSLVHDMLMMGSHYSYNEDFHKMLNPKGPSSVDSEGLTHGGNVGDEGLTRDFLGLKPFSHKDIFYIAGINHVDTSSSVGQQNQFKDQPPWQC